VHERVSVGRVGLLAVLVDVLPDRLWRLGNLYQLPGGDWHFCIASRPGTQGGVRTIEWRGRVVVRGRRPIGLSKPSD
jgi:hypothetical protein